MTVETSEERNEWEHVRVTNRAPSERSKRAGRRASLSFFGFCFLGVVRERSEIASRPVGSRTPLQVGPAPG